MIYVYLLAITSGMRTPEPMQTVPGPDPARGREGPPPPPDALPVQKETNKNSEKTARKQQPMMFHQKPKQNPE